MSAEHRRRSWGGTTAGKLCILAQCGPILSLTNKNLVFSTPIWSSIVVLRLLQQTQRIKFKYKWILRQDNTGIYIWMSTFIYMSVYRLFIKQVGKFSSQDTVIFSVILKWPGLKSWKPFPFPPNSKKSECPASSTYHMNHFILTIFSWKAVLYSIRLKSRHVVSAQLNPTAYYHEICELRGYESGVPRESSRPLV